MAAPYRYQVVSVGMWRGKIKRWNTTFYNSVSTRAGILQGIMRATGYPNPGDAVGACSGGVASIAVYNPTGGAPISNNVYFDWETPTTWQPFLGTAWAGVPAGTPLDASGESAALIVGKLPGLSKTGKPMSTRKYLHAIPSRTAAAYDDPDIDPAVAAAIAAQFSSDWMLTPAGVGPSSVVCEAYYGNHQRRRGRRRTVAQVAAQSYSAGVVTGAATGGGGSTPFRVE